MSALSPVVGLAAGAIWLVVAAISRYSSLAALMAAGWAPIVVAFITDGQIFALASVLAVLIYVRHAANIGRLRRGEESKIGKK